MVSAGRDNEIARNEVDDPSSLSISAWSRGNVLSASRAHVDASARARSSSSASRSCARSRMRRGSTKSSSQSTGNTSVSSKSFSINHGNQLSMPSKFPPSANRSQCSRPHDSVATSDLARSMTCSSSCSSRAAKMTASSNGSVERWSLTLNEVSLSTSSPHKSMRTGVLEVLGKMSMIEPRRAISPRCSTSSSRR